MRTLLIAALLISGAAFAADSNVRRHHWQIAPGEAVDRPRLIRETLKVCGAHFRAEQGAVSAQSDVGWEFCTKMHNEAHPCADGSAACSRRADRMSEEALRAPTSPEPPNDADYLAAREAARLLGFTDK